MTPDLAEAIRQSAARIGVNPLDLATVISYETAGTFDPWKAGPTTQWGQHRGLIQWGEPQRQKYGVFQGMPVAEQMRATERYLTDAGVRPGMGLLDLYSAVNAGRVGRYGASDANNGGAPGTVADKVRYQMEGHKQKAASLLGLKGAPGGPPPPVEQAGAAPTLLASAAPTLLASAAPAMSPAAVAVSAIPDLYAQRQAREKARQDEDAARKQRLAAAFGVMS